MYFPSAFSRSSAAFGVPRGPRALFVGLRGLSHLRDYTLILTLKQNGCHFADYNVKCIFLDENHSILFQFSLNFVGEGSIDNKRHWFGKWFGKLQGHDITWTNVDKDLWRHMASVGHNGFNGTNRLPTEIPSHYKDPRLLISNYWIKTTTYQHTITIPFLFWFRANQSIHLRESDRRLV